MPLPIKEEELKNITKKVYALYAKHGPDGISMDELSAQADISKATLYRYFTSKEDIVKGMVQYLISHLDSVQFTDITGFPEVMDDIRAFYVKSLMIEALSGLRFLKDLQRKYPAYYADCTASMTAMQERFAGFYAQSVKMGCFRDLPFPLVGRQFRNMLPVIISMDDLERYQIPLPEAVRSYYRMFLCQILDQEYLSVTEQEETYAFADDLAKVLLDDFFIDSIRR